MKNLTTALTLAIAAAAAQAAPVVTVTPGPFSGAPGVCSIDFDGSGCASVAFSGGALRSTSISGVAARPPGSTGNYLAVGPDNNSGEPARFTIGDPGAALYNYFGFLAGSLDTYNSILFSYIDGAGIEQSYTGAQLAAFAGVPADGDQGVSRYFNVFLTDGFYSRITLSSSANAFEVDNVALGAASVPLPGVLALLGAGLLAGGLASRRRAA